MTLYKWKSLLSPDGEGGSFLLGSWLRPLKLASSLVKAISTDTMSFAAYSLSSQRACQASPRPPRPSMALMKLSSGRVSRTNRRFNFLNALISPVGYIGRPSCIPKDVAESPPVKTRPVLHPTGYSSQLQATSLLTSRPRLVEILLLRKVSYPRIGNERTRHTSYSWLSPPRVVACHATCPTCCPLLFARSSFLKCITTIAITRPPNLRVVRRSRIIFSIYSAGRPG